MTITIKNGQGEKKVFNKITSIIINKSNILKLYERKRFIASFDLDSWRIVG